MKKRDTPLSERNSSDTVSPRGVSTDDIPPVWEQWLDCITDMLFIADGKGRIVRANKAMAEAFGTTAEKLAGRNCREVLYGGESPPEEPACQAVLKSGGCVRREVKFPGLEGVYLSSAYCLVRPDGSVGGALAWIKDITERKRAEEVLRKEREFSESVTKTANSIIISFDRNGIITAFNRFAEEFTGYKREEVLGKNWMDTFSPERYREKRHRLFRELMSAPPGKRTGENTIVCKNGEEKIVHWSVSLLKDEDGSVKSALYVGNDMTERKRADDLTVIQRDLALALSAAPSLDEALRLCVKTAIRAGGMDSGGMYLVDETSGCLNLEYYEGLSPDFIRRSSRFDADVPQARLVLAGKPVYTSYQRVVSNEDAYYSEGLKSIAIIPVRHENRVIACLNIASHSLQEITANVRNVLETIAAQIGGVIVRLRAEAALHKEKEFSENILETANSIVVILDDKAVIRIFNRCAEEITGYDRKEVIGKNWVDIFPPERYRGQGRESYQNILGGAWPKITGENIIICKSGEEKTILWSTSRLKDAGGDVVGLLAFGNDITKRKKAEEQLRQSRSELQEYIDGMVTLSARLAPDGTILTVSKAAVEISGMTLDELRGMPFWDAPWWSYDKDVQAMIRKDVMQAATGSHISRDVKIRAGEDIYIYINFGLTRVLHKDGTVKFIVAEGRDISERKRAEERLRERTELLDAVMSNMTESVTIENEDYEVEYMNRAAVEQYGDSVGRKCYEHYMGLSEPCGMLCPVEELLVKNVEAPISFNRRMPNKRESEMISNIVTGKDGRPVVLTVGRDVTEKKHLEEQLIQAQKMETVGTLAGGVAHEFNNLHCGILGYLEIILKREKLSGGLRDNLERVHLAARRAAGVTRNLLAFSRRQPVMREAASLDDVVLETLRIIQAEFRTTGLRVETDLRAAREFVMDRGQIGQVVMNLLVNARDAMVNCERREIIISTALDGKRATLKVSDTGCGIPAGDLKRIFEPFFTTKGALGAAGTPEAYTVSGTGLGLSVCYGIIKDHGGTITVESEQGVGTTFTVTVPFVKPQAAAKRKMPQVRAMAGKRVVLVDDDEMVRGMMLEILKAEGYHAIGFDDGKKALADIKRHKTDVVIVDLQMPGVSGVEFLKRVNQMPESERPVKIVITGKPTDEKMGGYSELDVFDTVYKPFTSPDLLERLYTALH